MEYAFEETPLRNRTFEKLLLEAVDEGLSSLGDSAKYTIYFHLKKTFDINRRDIPNKIEEFANAIEEIFGHGAKILEILIMRRLYEKVGNPLEYNQVQEDLVFTQYVAAARQSFLKRKKQDAGGGIRGNESQRLCAPVIPLAHCAHARLMVTSG